MVQEGRAQTDAGGLQVTDTGTTKTTAPKSVDEYLAPLANSQRAALEEVRRTIISAAPDATESINYGVPFYKYKGKSLISFGAAKTHLAIYGSNTSFAEKYQQELAAFDRSPGTIRFTPENPIPADLVRHAVQIRIEEINAQLQSKKK
jgi:uncharacterized protein YdhG (YjbR/CyaY superfamily)